MIVQTPIPAYDSQQLRQYLDYIGFWSTDPASSSVKVDARAEPTPSHITDTARATNDINTIPADYATLARIMQRHLCTIPFSNVLVHHESTVPSVDTESLFQRLVIERKSFYCFGQDILLLGMLKALGYSAYAGVARSNFTSGTDASYAPGPISHIVLLVELDSLPGFTGGTYAVDVGYGGVNYIRPIRIPDNGDTEEPLEVYAGVGPENYRARMGRIPGARPGSQARCFIEHQTGVAITNGQDLRSEGVTGGTGKEWKAIYSFSLEEHFLNDFNVLHWGTCTATNGPQSFRIVAVKLEEVLPDSFSDDRDKFARRILVNDVVKRRYQGRTEVLAKFSSEAERIEALKKYFGIVIDEGDSVIKTRPLYLG